MGIHWLIQPELWAFTYGTAPAMAQTLFALATRVWFAWTALYRGLP